MTEKTPPPLPAALVQFDTLPDSALVNLRIVALLEGASMSTIWRRIADGTLPSPIKTGGINRMLVGDLRAARRNSSPPSSAVGG